MDWGKAEIKISMANEAFDPSPGVELARILQDIVNKLKDDPESVTRGGKMKLRDLNGNVVGKLWISGGGDD